MNSLDPADTSPEIQLRLDLFARELSKWRQTTNLVSKLAYSEIWNRHLRDSLQIRHLAPTAKRWLDIGTGAGFPGIVIAIQLYGVQDAEVHCVESDKRKCAFLTNVVRQTGIPAIIHPVRIEQLESTNLLPIDAVTARALTAFPRLMTMCRNYLDAGALGIFPLGQNYQAAVAYLDETRVYASRIIESKTNSNSRILCVSKQTVQSPW